MCTHEYWIRRYYFIDTGRERAESTNVFFSLSPRTRINAYSVDIETCCCFCTFNDIPMEYPKHFSLTHTHTSQVKTEKNSMWRSKAKMVRLFCNLLVQRRDEKINMLTIYMRFQWSQNDRREANEMNEWPVSTETKGITLTRTLSTSVKELTEKQTGVKGRRREQEIMWG